MNDKKKAFIVSKVVTSLDKKHTRVRIHISNESKYQKQPVAFFLIADTVPHKVTEIRLIKDKKESKLKTLKVEEKTLEKDVKKALESKRSSVLLIEDRLVFLLKSNKAPLALKQSDFIELSYDYKKSAIHELEIVETHIFEGSESEEFEPQEFTKEFISNLILKEEVEKQEETQETKEPNKSKEHKQDE